MKPVKVGIVGMGFMGTIHAEAYKRSLAAELVAVADTQPEAADKAGERFGVKAFTDLRTMLKESGAEAVSICTSEGSHLEPALACVEAGRHVLLEEPIATTPEDADRIVAAAKASAKKFMVGHLLRFDTSYAEVKKRTQAGELGELETIFARRLNTVAAQDLLRGRVSVLACLGIHDFDYTLWLTGSRPVEVHTEAVGKVHRAAGYDVEDHTFTLIRFENGVIACVEAGWLLPRTHPRRADFKLDVQGTKGTAHVDQFTNALAFCDERGWRVPGYEHSAIDAEVGHFLNCVRHDEQPLISAEDAREAFRLCYAAQESERTGRIVRMLE